MAPPKRFVPRQRKHKVLARQAREAQAAANEHPDKESANGADTNALEILPEKVRERNARKERLREELRGQATQMSAKKAKRLEKYIETKLRKDESRALYEKLAANRIDTSMFESSRNLGQGKRRRRAERAENSAQKESDDEEDDAEEGASESTDSEPEVEPERKAPPVVSQPAPPNVESSATAGGSSLFASAGPAVVGSGLKRPLELGDDGRPVLQKRQKRGGVKSKYQLEQVQQPTAEESDEWSGFSTDDGDAPAQNGEADESESGSSDADSSSDESSDNDTSEDEDNADDKPQVSGFKAWAEAQRNEVLDFKPSGNTTSLFDIPKPDNFKPRPVEQDPLPIELQPSTNIDRKTFNVSVVRSADIDDARLALPILAEEQQIMEAIHNNDVVVISGGTGSGKTTQVPQFLYEAGYGSPDSPNPGMIGITQPRRVAAVSMAKRVTQELGDHGKVVAYQIRFEGTATKNTAIKFMTDGILLRELAEDIVLSRYSAIIVDEAHERSINTDVLIGILSRVNTMRLDLNKRNASTAKPLAPLKLIIMSATLQITDLTENARLFPVPPRVVSIEGRQFPVTMHFSRVTHHDYAGEALRKIIRGHRKLPPGGFLVFLTGEDEILQLASQLREKVNGLHTAVTRTAPMRATDGPLEAEDMMLGDHEVALLGEDDFDKLDDDFNEADGNEEEEIEFEVEEGEAGTGPLRMNVLPLFSKLTTREQQKVFQDPPDGYRQVILATNVAETSLTIPGIRYVFDCGRSKERKYNSTTGVQRFEVGWISKASAHQRSGRAGRTAPGHCYRLYSSAVFEENFPEFAEPEVLRMPIEDVVLQLKAMNIPNISMFPFPTPPQSRDLVKAEKRLEYLGAIQPSGVISELGKIMSVFPLSPRFTKILVLGHVENCLPYVLAMVAGLSGDELFVHPNRAIPKAPEEEPGSSRTPADIVRDEERRQIAERFKRVHRQFRHLDEKCDALKVLEVVRQYSKDPTEQWCKDHFVHYKALREIQKIRKQLYCMMQTHLPHLVKESYQEKLDEPAAGQVPYLKQMAAAGFIENVAIRADMSPNPPEMERKPNRAIDVPYIPLLPLPRTGSQFVYIRADSSMSHLTVAECPKFVYFMHLQESTKKDSNDEAKVRMRTLTDLPPAQLVGQTKDTPLLSYGKPIKETYLSDDGYERECWVIPYVRAEAAGGMGWPLPAVKVRQRKIPGKGWNVIKVYLKS